MNTVLYDIAECIGVLGTPEQFFFCSTLSNGFALKAVNLYFLSRRLTVSRVVQHKTFCQSSNHFLNLNCEIHGFSLTIPMVCLCCLHCQINMTRPVIHISLYYADDQIGFIMLHI